MKTTTALAVIAGFLLVFILIGTGMLLVREPQMLPVEATDLVVVTRTQDPQATPSPTVSIEELPPLMQTLRVLPIETGEAILEQLPKLTPAIGTPPGGIPTFNQR